MFRCGLLVVSPACLKGRIPSLLKLASQEIREVLYVDIHGSRNLPLRSLYGLLGEVYGKSSPMHLDVRVLLPEVGQHNTRILSQQPEIVLIRDFSNDIGVGLHELKAQIQERFSLNQTEFKILSPYGDGREEESRFQEPIAYEEVVLGGTFDHIHAGHRLLLGVSCLLCEKRITVGLSDGALLSRKVLKELMQKFEDRKGIVEQFIEDIKPGLQHNVEPITDPIGPAGIDPNLKCLVVSQETIKGRDFVNEARRKNGLNDLEIHVIDLITEENDNFVSGQETGDIKMSSTLERHKLLGTVLRPSKKQSASESTPGKRPFVIGLTGGIGSGKSAICKRLEGLGAKTINCDLLGHQAYLPSTKAYNDIISAFGIDVISSDGSINRKALGAVVFSDKSKLSQLNQIVWPAIRHLAEDKIREFGRQGVGVCVIEAAVLLEAGWDETVDEVWVSIIPEDEALLRMSSRDGMTEVEARRRLQAQMSNEERVARANVVLSSLWEPEYTQKQVERAWAGLQKRLTSLHCQSVL